MMIDTSEGEMNDRIVGGDIVIYRFKPIFPNQIRAARQAKLKLLAKRLLGPVRRCSDRRRLSVQNAIKRVACYHGKSRKPVIGKRKNVTRVEVRSAHVLRPNIGLEIGLCLVGCVNAGVKREPCREVMRERQSEVSVFIVRARIEKLGKAPHANQTELCPFPGAIVREDKVFSREK